MFFISLRYVKPLAVIDSLISEHVAYLREQYAAGIFLLSGRKVPRDGGVIVCRGVSREELARILSRDPFARAGAAEYDIVEFTPSMAGEGLEGLLES
jgi:uncharacterized protein YciI